jgi:Na+-transporting NADH:ubiquinone oxidoreductase subunit NqrC
LNLAQAVQTAQDATWLTPQVASIICLALTTLGGIITTWLQKNKKDAEAAGLNATILGVEAFAQKKATGEATGQALKETIQAVATDKGTQDFLHERVQALTAPPTVKLG